MRISLHISINFIPFSQQYVQNHLMEQSEKIYSILFHEKGHFYVCGDVSMAEDVCKTLKIIFRENGIDDPDQALINLRVNEIPFLLSCITFS